MLNYKNNITVDLSLLQYNRKFTVSNFKLSGVHSTMFSNKLLCIYCFPSHKILHQTVYTCPT